MKKVIFSVCVVMLMAACSSNKNATQDITGRWAIQKAMGLSTETGETPAFINFEADGKMNGNASVNNFNGNYKLDGESLKLTNIGITRMMGASMEVEDAITSALNSTATIKAEGNTAYVLNQSQDTILILVKE